MVPWTLRSIALASLILAGCGGSNKQPPIQGLSAVPSQATATPAAVPQAVVTASRGKVELLRGASGSWADAKVGDRLSAEDALRTGEGEADLAVDGVKLRLHDASRLDMRSIDQRALRARIHGVLEGEVDPQGKADVEIGDTGSVAHSEGGHFFVTADGKDVVTVASVTGAVHLTAKNGNTVVVNKGEVSRLESADAAPSPPAAALRRVLLAVQWPSVKETNQSTVPISGRVEPGSRVFVQGRPVTVEKGGIFRAEVPLQKGKQKIAVVTVDALGRRKEVEGVVRRDDSLPGARVKKKLWQWH